MSLLNNEYLCYKCNQPHHLTGFSYACIQCHNKGERWRVCQKCEMERPTYHSSDHAFVLITKKDITYYNLSKIMIKISNYKTNLKKTHHDDPCSSCKKYIYSTCWTKVDDNCVLNYHLCDSCFNLISKEDLKKLAIGWVKRQSFFNIKEPTSDTSGQASISSSSQAITPLPENSNNKESNIKEPYIPEEDESVEEVKKNSYFGDYNSSYYYDSSQDYSNSYDYDTSTQTADSSSDYDDSAQSSYYSQGYYSSDKSLGYSSGYFSGYSGDNKGNNYEGGGYFGDNKGSNYESGSYFEGGGYSGDNKGNSYEGSGYYEDNKGNNYEGGGYFGDNKGNNYEGGGYFGDKGNNYEGSGYNEDNKGNAYQEYGYNIDNKSQVNYEGGGYFGDGTKNNYEGSGYFGENKGNNYEGSGYYEDNKGNTYQEYGYHIDNKSQVNYEGGYFGDNKDNNYEGGGYFGENKDNNYQGGGYFGDNVYGKGPSVQLTHSKRSNPQKANQNDDSRDWNEEFQILIKKFKSSSEDKKLDYALQLNALAEEFINTAVSIGKIIIEEVALNARSKTVKPVSVGGIAGGEKYISKGIFFKFAIDAFGVYGGDEYAQKAASHELAGLKAYYNTNIEGLHTPFMLLMDYRGYRLIATTRLPIGKNSLIYGSADGGNTIKRTDEVFNDYMEKASKILNIKEHRVGIRNQTEILHAPTDIEGHLGEDGRYYVLDTARICPPEPIQRGFIAILIPKDKVNGFDPLESIKEIELTVDKWLEQVTNILHDSENLEHNDENLLQSDEITEGIMYYIESKSETRCINSRASCTINKLVYGDAILLLHGRKGAQLFNLLRYELLERNPVPLSSDAFTPFGRHDKEIHNKEVEEAFFRLLGKDIPDFVKNIESIPTRIDAIKSIHKYGINIRLIGFLRSHIPKLDKYFPIRQWLLMEMITRITKNYLREQLRRATMKREPIEPIIVERFNLLLGESHQSNIYWNIILKAQLLSKFGKYGQSLTPEEINTSYNLKKDINKLVLFQILQKRTGVNFNVNLKFQMYPELFESESPFDISNVDSLSIHKKHLLDPDIKEFIHQKILEKAGNENIDNIVKLYQEYKVDDKLIVPHHLMNKAFHLLIFQDPQDYEEILTLCKTSLSYYDKEHWFTPIEITLRAYYIYACIYIKKKDYAIAEKYLYALYDSLMKMYNYKNDLEGYSTTHPFVLLVLNKLVQILLTTNRMLEVFALCYIIKNSWNSYPFKGNMSKLEPYFGKNLKLTLDLFETSSFIKYRKSPIIDTTTESNEQDEINWIKNLTMEIKSEDLYLSPKVIENYIQDNKSNSITIAEAYDNVDIHLVRRQPMTWPIQSLNDFKNLHISMFYNKSMYLLNAKDLEKDTENKFVEVLNVQGENTSSKLNIKAIKFDNPNAMEGTYFLVPEDYAFKKEINLNNCSYPIHVIDSSTINSALLEFIPINYCHYFFNWDRQWDNRSIKSLSIASNDKESVSILDENGVIWSYESINKGPYFGDYKNTTFEAKKIAKMESYKVASSSFSSTHSLFLLESGEVFSQGINSDGQLGLGDKVDRSEIRLVNKLKGIKISKIFAYERCSMAIDENGIVYQWGFGFSQFPEKNTYFEKNNIKIVKAISHLCKPKIMSYFYVTDQGCVYYSYYEKELTLPLPCNFFEKCIIDITCNHKYIFALTSDGEVYKMDLFYEYDPVKNKPKRMDCYEDVYFTSIYSTDDHTFAIDENNDLYMIGPKFSPSFIRVYLAGFKVNQIACSHQSAIINIVKHKNPIPHHPLMNKERPYLIGDRFNIEVIKGDNDKSFKIIWEKPRYVGLAFVKIVEKGTDTLSIPLKAYLSSKVSEGCTGELHYSFIENICGTHEVVCPLLNGEYEVIFADSTFDDFKILYRSEPFTIGRTADCTIKFPDVVNIYTPIKISYSSENALSGSCITIHQVSTNTLYNVEFVNDKEGEFEYTFYFDGEYKFTWQSNYGEVYDTYYTCILNVTKPKIAPDITMKIKTTGPYYTSSKINVEWEFEGKVPFAPTDNLSLYNADSDINTSIPASGFIMPNTRKGIQKDYILPANPGEYQWRYRMVSMYNNMSLMQVEVGPTITIIEKPEEEEEVSYEEKIEIIEDTEGRSYDNWKELFEDCKFESEVIEKYTNIMESNNIKISLAHIIDFSLLKELDIPLPHRLVIMQKIYNLRENRIKKYIDQKLQEK